MPPKTPPMIAPVLSTDAAVDPALASLVVEVVVDDEALVAEAVDNAVERSVSTTARANEVVKDVCSVVVDSENLSESLFAEVMLGSMEKVSVVGEASSLHRKRCTKTSDRCLSQGVQLSKIFDPTPYLHH